MAIKFENLSENSIVARTYHKMQNSDVRNKT